MFKMRKIAEPAQNFYVSAAGDCIIKFKKHDRRCKFLILLFGHTLPVLLGAWDLGRPRFGENA